MTQPDNIMSAEELWNLVYDLPEEIEVEETKEKFFTGFKARDQAVRNAALEEAAIISEQGAGHRQSGFFAALAIRNLKTPTKESV